MKLNPEDLQVTSFDTADATIGSPYEILRPTTPMDPTAQTYCFVCPVHSENCY